MRTTDSNGEDRNFECDDPPKGKPPLSTKRRVNPAGLLGMIAFVVKITMLERGHTVNSVSR